VSDVAWEVQVSFDAVADCCEEVLCLFEWIVSINDDTPNILTAILRVEEGSTISTSELTTVALRSVSVVSCEARLGARDHPLATEQHLIDISFGALNTCLIDEGSSLCESVRACEGLKASQTLLEDCLVGDGHVEDDAVESISIDAAEFDSWMIGWG